MRFKPCCMSAMPVGWWLPLCLGERVNLVTWCVTLTCKASDCKDVLGICSTTIIDRSIPPYIHSLVDKYVQQADGITGWMIWLLISFFANSKNHSNLHRLGLCKTVYFYNKQDGLYVMKLFEEISLSNCDAILSGYISPIFREF